MSVVLYPFFMERSTLSWCTDLVLYSFQLYLFFFKVNSFLCVPPVYLPQLHQFCDVGSPLLFLPVFFSPPGANWSLSPLWSRWLGQGPTAAWQTRTRTLPFVSLIRLSPVLARQCLGLLIGSAKVLCDSQLYKPLFHFFASSSHILAILFNLYFTNYVK